ncbi:hypothetical protein SAMN05216338_104728 [Bradyrhizobium sp. Rc2d]|nr:hypothetical protein SAMN05216338_104728 [Bradyrhizobium sp. Rc2d]
MSVGTIIIAASAAFAFAIAGFALAHNGKAETVAPKFEQFRTFPANRSSPWKPSAPRAASVLHTHAKSAFI